MALDTSFLHLLLLSDMLKPLLQIFLWFILELFMSFLRFLFLFFEVLDSVLEF